MCTTIIYFEQVKRQTKLENPRSQSVQQGIQSFDMKLFARIIFRNKNL